VIRRWLAAALGAVALVVLPTPPATADGYVVDAAGGLHPFDGAPATTGTGWWPGRDLARGIARADSSPGGWVLDASGGLHPFGGAPAVTGSLWQPGRDVARGLAADDDGPGGWVVDVNGALHPFGGAPALPPTGARSVVGIVVDDDGPGGWVLDERGALHGFGGAPDHAGPRLARGVAVDDDGPGGWVVDAFGGLHAFGGAPAVSGTGWWPGRDLARAIVVDDDGPGGWVVDAFGGLHSFGGAPGARATSWWPGRDLARGATGGSGGRAALPPARRVVTYEVRTTGVTRSTAADLAASAADTYADRRGWRAAGIEFREVPSGGDFTLWLAAPNRMEGFSSVCSSFYSCRVGRNVIINDDRFTGGSPYWPGSVDDYRDMVVNHETGHWLGLGHAGCPGAGQPAPVMQQQSKGLQGCAPNPWPTRPSSGASAARASSSTPPGPSPPGGARTSRRPAPPPARPARGNGCQEAAARRRSPGRRPRTGGTRRRCRSRCR
jgi:hypothetical protein